MLEIKRNSVDGLEAKKIKEKNMSNVNIVEVKVSELVNGFYVREKFNDNHLAMLLSLSEGGVKFPPIEITKEKEIIDGRYRTELAKLLDKEFIEAIIIKDGKAETELAAQALGANLGGSLPPTKEDIIHTIKYLIGKSFPKDEIISKLSRPLPASMVRVLYLRATSEIAKAKGFRGAHLVKEDGLSIEEAAKRVGLKTIKPIQDALKIGQRDKLPKFNSIISSKFVYLNRGNGRLITTLFNAYKDGEISSDEVLERLDFLGKAISNTNRLFSDWQSRFSKMK